MSDKEDLSHLADEIPAELRTVSIERTPVESVVEGDEKGETKKLVTKPDGSPLELPTKVFSSLTGELQLRRAQAAKKPCAACAHLQHPKPGSSLWMKRKDAVHLAHEKAGIWKDLGETAFGYCEDDTGTSVDGSPNGIGFKWIGHNCPNWTPRTAEFLPEWLPDPVIQAINYLTAVSNHLRTHGIRGWLRRMRGEPQ